MIKEIDLFVNQDRCFKTTCKAQHIKRNTMSKYKCLIVALFVFASPLVAGGTERQFVYSGKTMGTTYSITVVASENVHVEDLQAAIDETLERVNLEMSTYRKDSVISRFNALGKADEKFSVPENFMDVLRVSRSVYELTGGAWDGTVNPLLELWGFRSKKPLARIPEKEKIEKTLLQVGFDKIAISDGAISKKDAAITLDLASIAKGHGVDRVSGVLLERGLKNFIVEIGGEIYASGLTEKGERWRAGINKPDKNAAFDEVYRVVTLTDAAMATSGDYRNFVEIDGGSYSHIIDPRTGYPVKNNVASATVIAPTCAFADGLATAAMVMGAEKTIGADRQAPERGMHRDRQKRRRHVGKPIFQRIYK